MINYVPIYLTWYRKYGDLWKHKRLLQPLNHAGNPQLYLRIGPKVNYYVKHLVQNADGGFNQALEWIVEGARVAAGQKTWFGETGNLDRSISSHIYKNFSTL